MRGPSQSTVKAVSSAARSRKSPIHSQPFSTTCIARDPSSAAESSTFRPESEGEPSRRENPAYEVFRRNVGEVQSFRRRRDATRECLPEEPLWSHKLMKDIKVPFIPPSHTPIQTKPTPLANALSTLVATGAALGCATNRLSKAYTPFIYGNRSGISIIDLDQTLPILRRTAALVRDVVKEDGVVLFVGKARMDPAFSKIKERMGDNGYTTNTWLPGLITNAETIFGEEAVVNKTYIPDLVIFPHARDHDGALRECLLRNIPTIGVIDSNTDPRLVTYPIPANAQSLRTAELVVGTLSLAGQEGRRLRLKEEEKRAARAAKGLTSGHPTAEKRAQEERGYQRRS